MDIHKKHESMVTRPWEDLRIYESIIQSFRVLFTFGERQFPSAQGPLHLDMGKQMRLVVKVMKEPHKSEADIHIGTPPHTLLLL